MKTKLLKMRKTMDNTDARVEALVSEFISKDEQNNLLDVYQKQTGKDPVPEHGGHTDEFESWFVSKVRDAVKGGCKTVESAVDFIRYEDEK